VVRGDAALSARLLLRRSGVAGLLAVLGAASLAVAATRPWHRAVADLSMLGDRQGRTVATMEGLPGTWWGWTLLAVALVAAGLGAATALDRPPASARRALVLTGVLALAVAAVATLRAPSIEQLVGPDGADLLALADRLPSGVELEVTARLGPAPMMAVAGGLLILLAVALADEL
jgi:hypothetical protein